MNQINTDDVQYEADCCVKSVLPTNVLSTGSPTTQPLTPREEQQAILKNLNEQHANLLCRLVGVSDDILREQLREEYIAVENSIAETTAKIESLDKQAINELSKNIFDDMRDFYVHQFRAVDSIIEAINVTNQVDLSLIAQQHRVRLPTSISDRRTLCLLTTVLNRQIKLLDYEGILIDTIGREYSNAPLIIYIMCFSKYDDLSNLTQYSLGVKL